MTPAKLRLAMAAMGQPETKVGDLCQELGITRQTLYRHISPEGELRPDGAKLLARAWRLRVGVTALLHCDVSAGRLQIATYHVHSCSRAIRWQCSFRA